MKCREIVLNVNSVPLRGTGGEASRLRPGSEVPIDG